MKCVTVLSDYLTFNELQVKTNDLLICQNDIFVFQSLKLFIQFKNECISCIVEQAQHFDFLAQL